MAQSSTKLSTIATTTGDIRQSAQAIAKKWEFQGTLNLDALQADLERTNTLIRKLENLELRGYSDGAKADQVLKDMNL